jgi:hypothetical protein
VVLFLLPGIAEAIAIGASATMTVDGNEYGVTVDQSPDGIYGFGTYDSETGEFSGWESPANGEYSVSITGTLDPDPAIDYGIAVTDLGAPSNFFFLFNTPIIFGAVPNSVNASIVGGLNDTTGNGVSILPTLTDDDADTVLELQIAELSTGGPFVNMGVDVGLGQVHPGSGSGAFYTYGSYFDGPQPGPVAAWNALQVRLGFSLTGGGDIAVLTGHAEIVPEPSSVVLALGGGLALTWHLWRRRRRA